MGNILRRRLGLAIAILVVLVGLWAVLGDWPELHTALGELNWRPIPLTLACVLLSYLGLCYSFALVNRLFGIRLGWVELLEIGFVTIVLNNLFAIGGIAGYPLRILLLCQRRQSLQDILASSLFHSYFNGLGLLVLLPTGFVYIFLQHSLSPGAMIGIGLAAALFLLALLMATAALLSARLRAWTFALLARIGRVLIHRDIEPALNDFDRAVLRGIEALGREPRALALLVGSTALDWASCLVAMGLSFRALGIAPPWGVVATGFAIGVTAGILSMLPGGLGVQEGSMAGVYALLGVPLGIAVLAAVLFRAVHDFLPFILSLSLYRRLLRAADKAAAVM